MGVAYHPFPNHTVYSAGTILPSKPQASLDSSAAAFYDVWKQTYIRQFAGGSYDGQYYVFCNADGLSSGTHWAPGTISISEGHGYGMIIVATMAGYDPQAKVIFDGMFRWFKSHPTQLHTHLMDWNQISSGATGDSPPASASDGDLDVAYALLLADFQWGSGGTINYAAEADLVLADILAGETSSSNFIQLGDWAPQATDPQQYPRSLRSSDMMPDHFRVFARRAQAAATWYAVTDKTYYIAQSLQGNYSPSTGLLPDFVQTADTSPVPASAHFLETAYDGSYSWNACRDPWRFGTDYLVSGDTRAHSIVKLMTQWITTQTGGDPTKVCDTYRLDGSVPAGVGTNPMAFVAPFGVAAMTDATNQQWLNLIWDDVNATPASATDYYGNTVKMMCLLVMSGDWLVPSGLGAPG